MKNKIVGSFYGEDGFFHLAVEDGFPMLKVHGTDDELRAKLKFEDVSMLDSMIIQLEDMKKDLFLKASKSLF